MWMFSVTLPFVSFSNFLWKRQTCFKDSLIKNRGGLVGSGVNERRWHFKRTTLMIFSHWSAGKVRAQRLSHAKFWTKSVSCGWCVQPVWRRASKAWQTSWWTHNGLYVPAQLNIDVFGGNAGIWLPKKTQLVNITNANHRKWMAVTMMIIEF